MIFRYTLFVITSGSDIMQKRKQETFGGISDIHVITDDMIIAAQTLEEHDRILHTVMKRASDDTVKFNLNKVQC